MYLFFLDKILPRIKKKEEELENGNSYTSQWISSQTNNVLGFKQIKYHLM